MDPGLCGRQRECATVARLIEAARAGRGAALVVRGTRGAGKTRLLTFGGQLATELRVVRVCGAESEADLDYAALQQVCTPLMEADDGLPAPQRNALETAFGMRAGVTPNRLMVGLAVLGLLVAAARETALLCVVDDAQWLDAASAQALVFAARRIEMSPVLMLFAVREPVAEFAELPELPLDPLRDADARELLSAVLPVPIDPRVRDVIVAEAHGNPGTLLELRHDLSPAQLAGGFGLPAPRVAVSPDRLQQISGLPADTRLLLAVAAADPTGDPTLLWRAARELDIPPEAASPAAEAAVVAFGPRIVFDDSAARWAAYRSAGLGQRQAVHRALATASVDLSDQDHRAWHRALGATPPDEEAAAELEHTAEQAQERGGLPAAAAFLERAALLTADQPRRSVRALAAAETMLRAGDLDAAADLLETVRTGAVGEPEQARADAAHAFLLSRQKPDAAAPLLLDAARRLQSVDPGRAREAYADALVVALSAGGLAVSGATTADVAKGVLRAQLAGPPTAADEILQGLAAFLAAGDVEGAARLQDAVQTFRGGAGRPVEEVRWLPLAYAGACLLWDDEASGALARRWVAVAQETGTLGDLPSALTSLAYQRAVVGELAEAESLARRAQAVAASSRTGRPMYATAVVAALRCSSDQTAALIDDALHIAETRGEGHGVAVAKSAAAVFNNAQGKYDLALTASSQAIEFTDSPVVAAWAMTELVEAAARTAKPERAAKVAAQLSEALGAVSSDWALGIRSRSIALVSEGPDAEAGYRASIEHLEQSRARIDLGRAQLVYGEWLRRESRRIDARTQLRQAYEIFRASGAAGFAGRAQRELLATGQSPRRRGTEAPNDLTAQEIQIALRARNGYTNAEIGNELFISPRTVEWHLRKVFMKLGISSRKHLSTAAFSAV
jgi:DNA-binding CsgD family transcriptional regulator